ncbi:precorrin-2 C(20)-methyltransferase [Actinoplanes philippinensis]|uniref:precorrin-2 C(20)-methyltransferase n=1 Tax=Actinoplanes philippinensis TaxID=35752 RepID=UPI0033D07BF0
MTNDVSRSDTAAARTGRLFGVGLGPGDPELVTVKAARLIGAADVVAYHAARHGRSNARAIAVGYLREGQIEEALIYPVTTETTDHPGGYQGAIDEFYTEAAARLAAHLDAGRDVVVLAEGDPFFYGSYMHMHKRLSGRYETSVVPGVTSVSAASAVLGRPLMERDEVLTVLPGTLEPKELAARLATTDSAAVMKLGRTFEGVREALEEAGRLDDAWYVERATTDRERSAPLRDVDPATVPYFSLALLPSPAATAFTADADAGRPSGLDILLTPPATRNDAATAVNRPATASDAATAESRPATANDPATAENRPATTSDPATAENRPAPARNGAAAARHAGLDIGLVSPDTGMVSLEAANATALSRIKTAGRAGGVTVVGLGPGSRHWLTPEAQEALADADDLIGYGPYVDRVPPNPRQRRHPSDNRVEAERAAFALDLAKRGHRVAVVSSGDPGVFAMAAAVLEVAEDPQWLDVPVRIIPGLTAAQAVASRAGAPLGHDFCILSLSDRLKPWSVIESRLTAAAAADLVIAVYNPASKTRREQLVRALELLRAHRRPGTPVVVGRDVGGPEESVRITTLAALDPASVDMRCLLIIGSSQTRAVTRGDGTTAVYTPRHYPE